jgi:hypothetical protein
MEDKKKLFVKVEDNKSFEKETEIQDISVNINSAEEKPGVGLEILGITDTFK